VNTPIIDFAPAARAELADSYRRYRRDNPEVAAEFQGAFSDAIQSIATRPQWASPHLAGTRRFLVRGFPFGIVYRDLGTRIRVLAVAHTSRRPGYWLNR
jgi:plasmid stabilization system protein ParE